jgi:hypothetical protein
MQPMTASDFDATWIPRIGERGASELRRYRRVGMIAIVGGLAFAAGASIALGGDTRDKILGIVLLAGMVGALATFINCQRRLAKTVSEWYGVRISAGQLPVMNPTRFDTWRDRVGLHQGGQSDDTPLKPLTLEYDHKWGPIRWSRSARRDPGQD